MAFVAWRGPSLIDGRTIRLVVSGELTTSNNGKTGDMVQTWVMDDAVSPMEASKQGLDVSVCGDCVHRWSLDGACYVLLFQAPAYLWRFTDGFPVLSPEEGAERVRAAEKELRWGAYGDPALLPEALVRRFSLASKGHLGYTHRWRDDWASWSKNWFMASTDTVEERLEAVAMGWATYRVGYGREPGEARCPYEKGGLLTCKGCMVCGGLMNVLGKPKSIVNEPHGSVKKLNAAIERRLQGSLF